MAPKKSWFQYFKECITEKYYTFSGRASRTEYWTFILFSVLIDMSFEGLALALNGAFVTDRIILITIISSIPSLFFLIPRIAVGVRRFHDTNKGGWLIIVLEIIGFIIILHGINTSLAYSEGGMPIGLPDFFAPNLLYFSIAIIIIYMIASLYSLVVCVTKGTDGQNSFGPDPFYPELENEVENIGID